MPEVCLSKTKQVTPFYESKGMCLYKGKYEEILPSLQSEWFDAIISDPPYGNTDIEWDKSINWGLFWQEANRICKIKCPQILFASGKFIHLLINTNQKHYRYELIWEKNLAVGHLSANIRPLRAHENILIFTNKLFRGSTYNPQMIQGKNHVIETKQRIFVHYGGKKKSVPKRETNLYHPRSVLRFNNTRSKSLHPTQKPLDLMEWLVKTYSNRNEMILEPFAGSGTTMVAALRLGRRCIGIEQSEEYCEIIARRLEKGE